MLSSFLYQIKVHPDGIHVVINTYLTLNYIEYDYSRILDKKPKPSKIRITITFYNNLLRNSWLSVISPFCIKSVNANVARWKKQMQWNEQVSDWMEKCMSTSLKKKIFYVKILVIVKNNTGRYYSTHKLGFQSRILLKTDISSKVQGLNAIMVLGFNNYKTLRMSYQ